MIDSFLVLVGCLASTDPPFLLSINSKIMNLGWLSRKWVFYLAFCPTLPLQTHLYGCFLVNTFIFAFTNWLFGSVFKNCFYFWKQNQSIFFFASDVLPLHSFFKTILTCSLCVLILVTNVTENINFFFFSYCMFKIPFSRSFQKPQFWN